MPVALNLCASMCESYSKSSMSMPVARNLCASMYESCSKSSMSMPVALNLCASMCESYSKAPDIGQVPSLLKAQIRQRWEPNTGTCNFCTPPIARPTPPPPAPLPPSFVSSFVTSKVFAFAVCTNYRRSRMISFILLEIRDDDIGICNFCTEPISRPPPPPPLPLSFVENLVSTTANVLQT